MDFTSRAFSSVKLTLEIDGAKVFKPGSTLDQTKLTELRRMTELTTIGNDDGFCKQDSIRGEINWLEIEYTVADGISMLSFADE